MKKAIYNVITKEFEEKEIENFNSIEVIEPTPEERVAALEEAMLALLGVSNV